ncbi:MAG TPA: DNA polymerase III subunit [Clostridiales bacterium]|jgi:DNA polymerase-3 subunit delta'|nr:DNA polymerase III subunit [Clostridiales bacterium]
MIKYQKLFQKTRVYKTIDNDLKLDNLFHSYLVITDDDEVKYNLSALLLARIFCPQEISPCGQCPSCQKVISKTHTDIHYYEGKVTVEDIAKIIEQSALKPYSSDKNIFVIYDLQDMNLAAQNKLLKTLEEPQKGVLFLMFANDSAMVLPTVLSRSQVYNFEKFSVSDIQDQLSAQFDQDDVLIAASISGGRLDTAVKYLIDDEYRAMYNLAFEIINNMRKSADILDYYQKVERHKNRLKEFLELFYIVIRDIMVIQCADIDLVLCKNRINDIMVAASSISLKAATQMLDLIVRMRQRLFYSGNLVSVIDELLFSYLEVKALCQ